MGRMAVRVDSATTARTCLAIASSSSVFTTIASTRDRGVVISA